MRKPNHHKSRRVIDLLRRVNSGLRAIDRSLKVLAGILLGLVLILRDLSDLLQAFGLGSA
jgi:hypothetical protein